MSAYSRLQQRLQELGITPKKGLGQNFLVEDSVIERIVQSVQSSRSPSVIEIGPGCGALTEGLLNLGKPLTLIELDRVLAAYWQAQGLRVIEQDALKVNWRSAEWASGPYCLVSNLPYQISSSLVVDLALGPEAIFDMILMFQKEVAERILARPRTEAYGLLSVMAQLFFKIQRVVDASPQCFFPKPNIASRVLSFERVPSPLPGRERQFLNFVKQAFAQRRKLMVNNLATYRPASEWAQILTEQGHSPKVRAEELSPTMFLDVFVKGVP